MPIELPSGIIQQSPWLAMAHKQLELMHKDLTDLGLSPTFRSRVSAMPSVRIRRGPRSRWVEGKIELGELGDEFTQPLDAVCREGRRVLLSRSVDSDVAVFWLHLDREVVEEFPGRRRA